MTLLPLRTAVDFQNHLPFCLTTLWCGQVLFVLLWVRWWLAQSSLYTTANGQCPSQSIWTTIIEMRAEWTPFTQGDCCWVGHHRCVIRARYYHPFMLFSFIIYKNRLVIVIHTWNVFYVESKLLIFYFLISQLPSNKMIFYSLLLVWIQRQWIWSNIHFLSVSFH